MNFETARTQDFHKLEFSVCLNADFYRADKALHDLAELLSASNESNHCSEIELQALVRATFPELWELAQTLKSLLRSRVPAIVVENLPFGQIDLKNSKLAFLAFASCIGCPTSVDPYSGTRVWEVTPRSGLALSYVPTVTEHNERAELHTDSSFKVTPEQYVLMFAYRPASDGGGISQLLPSDLLMAKLTATDDGKECVRFLRSYAMPFRVPTIFTKSHSESDIEWIAAPILSSHPAIRYRYDLIESAVKCLPVTLSADAAWALSHLLKVLATLTLRSVSLASGDLLITDNHSVLHGRTPFEDPDRLLLRVRLSTAL